jgi:hypothetical protein
MHHRGFGSLVHLTVVGLRSVVTTGPGSGID